MTRRVFTLEQDKEVARLYQSGLSSIKIAKLYGIDKSSVLNALNRQGIKRRRGTIEPTSHDVIAGMKEFSTKLLTPSEADQVYKIYDVGGFSLNQISLAYGFGKHGRGLSRALKEQGYELRGGKALTEEQEQEAIELYNDGSSAGQIAKRFDVSESAIFRILNGSTDVEMRKHTPTYQYKFNRHAFDKIDNEQAAYWLGFLYADGTLYQKNEVIVSLSPIDTEQVKKFRDFMQSNHRIYETTRTGFNKQGKVVNIRIKNYHLGAMLHEKGIVKNRTAFQKTLQSIKPGLERHFIRGYLDGDGCIRGAYNPSVTFVGQKDILRWIRSTFYENLATNPNLRITKGKNIYSIGYTGINQARKIVDWLYKDATVWMERKRAKVDTWP
jgi:DNA invertase Pin-like site-specific DNA recombinase